MLPSDVELDPIRFVNMTSCMNTGYSTIRMY